MKCLLCGSKTKLKFNLKFDHCLYSEKKLYDLIDFLLKDIPCDHYNICKNCYNVLNELDSLKMKCEIIYYKFKSQLEKSDVEEVEEIVIKSENLDSTEEVVPAAENASIESSPKVNKQKTVKIVIKNTKNKKKVFKKESTNTNNEAKEKNNKEKTVCEICGKDVLNINLHKQIHNPVRLKCDLCDVTFSLRSSLWRHKRIHTGKLIVYLKLTKIFKQ